MTYRLFLAAWPPERVVARLGALTRPEEHGVTWVRTEQLHVTVRFYGDGDPEELIARLSLVDLPAAVAMLGPEVQLLGRSVVMVPVAGLDVLAAMVAEVTADLAEPGDDRPFVGHVTLARLRHRATTAVLGSWFATDFDVDELSLVNSTLTAEGPRYEVLHRFRLTG